MRSVIFLPPTYFLWYWQKLYFQLRLYHRRRRHGAAVTRFATLSAFPQSCAQIRCEQEAQKTCTEPMPRTCAKSWPDDATAKGCASGPVSILATAWKEGMCRGELCVASAHKMLRSYEVSLL